MWARWADGETVYYGQTVALKRGEFIASYRFLADRWRWSVKMARDFVTTAIRKDRLQLISQAKHRAQKRAQERAQLPQNRAQKRAQLAGVYLIVNYDRYNPVSLVEGTVEGTVVGKLGIGKGTEKGTKKKEGSKEGINTTSGTDVPENWVADAVALYAEHIGLIDYGRMGKALKPAVATFGGWATIRPWFAAYCFWRPLQRKDGTYPDTLADAEKNPRFCSPEEFVNTIAIWREMARPADLNAMRHA
jgi:hypothetical protein